MWLLRITTPSSHGAFVTYCWVDTPVREEALRVGWESARDGDVRIDAICSVARSETRAPARTVRA